MQASNLHRGQINHMSDKIFIGKVFNDKWGNPSLSMDRNDLEQLTSNLNGDGKVKLVIRESQKNKGKFYAVIDTWQPNQR